MPPMPRDATYLPESLTRADVDAMSGAAVLDFGTNWCSICRAALPNVEAACEANPGIRHIRVEDGPGRPLGRAYGVKLWPTLIFLRDGREMARLVRPVGQQEVADALRSLGNAAA